MSALRSNPRWHPRALGTVAILCLGLAWGSFMHSGGWAQSSFYAQEEALAHGRATIDRHQWQTGDKAWYRHHFYSVKAPGLALFTLPAYLALEAAGGKQWARDAAAAVAESSWDPWRPDEDPPWASYGYSRHRAHVVEAQVANTIPMIWVLTLVGATLPAVALLFCVRWVADRIEPGYGTAAAITLGVATIVMTFASEYFSHVASATLAFGAFALLFAERRGRERLWLVALAGLLAGLAVCFEYPVALAGAVLLCYALARGRRLRRGAAYALPAALGAAPALAYNAWSLGSPLRFAYSYAVSAPGFTGHDYLGLNSAGLFGITWPRPGGLIELLMSGRGILTLTPVLVMGVAGALALRQRGMRAESLVILGLAAVFLAYNSGYWLPMGGGTPGPRFLTPVMPFLALGLAPAYRRFRALTLGLAVASGTMMVAGALTYPLVGGTGIKDWAQRLVFAHLEPTVLTPLGVRDPWVAVLPVVFALTAAVALAARATPRAPLGPIRPALYAVGGWSVASLLMPLAAGDEVSPLRGGYAGIGLVALAAATSAATLLFASYSEPAEAEPSVLLEPLPAGERSS